MRLIDWGLDPSIFPSEKLTQNFLKGSQSQGFQGWEGQVRESWPRLGPTPNIAIIGLYSDNGVKCQRVFDVRYMLRAKDILHNV